VNDDFEQLDDYAILGVQPGATPAEIKQAYLKQISIYHPDRFAGASPDEQAYAARRARRINQAYQNLRRRRPSPVIATSTPRNYQAELYAKAQEHLAAGRRLQALATLRELQRINPWYRDCADLIAGLEADLKPTAVSTSRTFSRRNVLTVAFGGVAVALLGWFGWRQLQEAEATRSPVATAVAEEATAVPSPTVAPSPTTAPSPTAAASPTAAPSPTAVPSPTAAPSPTTGITGGTVVYQADFGPNSDWPITNGNGWSVGARDGRYIIQANAGLGDIWAFQTSPIGSEMVIEVEVSVAGDWAGLMFWFNSPQRYISFLINPAQGQYRCDERNNEQRSVLAEGTISLARSNRLTVRLTDQTIALQINDQVVDTLTITSLNPDPRYGLLVRAERNPTTATFSTLTLRTIT
jgi:hypothetical protein